MNQRIDVFGKEVEGLLREVAADPRSSLLRVQRPRFVRGFLERQVPVPASATGFSALERELIRVHRQEVADAFLRACLARLFSEPRLAPFLNRSRTLEQDIQFDSLEEWRTRAAKAIELSRKAPGDLPGIELLEACVGGREHLRQVSITQFARAAQRLCPSDAAEIYVAIDLVHSGQPGASRRLLQQVVARRPARFVFSAALENLGMAEARLGDYAAASKSYRQAFAAMEGRPSTLVGWLFMSLQAGLEDQSLLAGRLLDDMVSGDVPSIDALIENYRTQKQLGLLEPTREGRRFAGRLQDRFGPKGGRIADVLH